MRFSDLIGHWPKTCSGCSKVWGREDWRALDLASRAWLTIGAWIELRRCRCGELLAVAIAENDQG